MPWTAQGSKNEIYVPNEPAVETPWGEQGTESEAYVPSESTAEPWGEQGSNNEPYIPSELAVEAWGEQNPGDEVYVKEEGPDLHFLVYSESGELVFALNGSPVSCLFVAESPWMEQIEKSEIWV